MGPEDDRWEAAQEGVDLLSEGFVDEAIAELEARLADDPDNEHVAFFFGKALREKGEHARALKAFLHAIERVPGYLGALIEAGRTLQAMGRPVEATRMAREILARVPDDPDALFLAGVSLYQMAEYDEARPFLQRFLAGPHQVEPGLDARALLDLIAVQTGEATPDEAEEPPS